MKKTKFAEEKSKGSKALSVVIIVLLVFLAIFAVSFGESHLSSKSDKQVSVGQLDASSEPMVEQTKLYREYNGDGFILSLTEQGDYVLVGNDATYQFTGTYVVKRGQEGEFLDCKQKIDACKCYTDRDDFEDDVADFLAGEEQYRDLPDNEFNAIVERTVNEYDDFWKPCILLLVDN